MSPRIAHALGWAGLVAVVVLSLAPLPGVSAPAGSDKLGHAAAWMLLAAWWGALLPRRWPGIAVGLLALGGLLEALQALLPWRQFEAADLAANLVGVLAGTLLARGPAGDLLARVFERRANR